jgi:hypothetical protein
MGLSPITHVEMTAWSEGMKLDLLPFERKAIRAIDRAYMIYQNSKAAKERKNERD